MNGDVPTCYRHPDRETRLACSVCDRPVCVDCARTAAVGQKCHECAAPPRGARTIDMDQVRAVGGGSAVVSYTVLAISIAVFLLPLLLPGAQRLVQLFGAQINPLVAEGQWWRLLTAAFLHANTTHILFNMWALYVFGPQLEREVGSLPFLGLYAGSALAGGALFYVLAPSGNAVGASGAIFGLFGAWLVAAYRGRHTTAGQANFRQLLVLLGINLALPLVPGFNIAWQAHLGGLLAGLVVALAWGVPAVRRRTSLRFGVGAAIGVLALSAVIAL